MLADKAEDGRRRPETESETESETETGQGQSQRQSEAETEAETWDATDSGSQNHRMIMQTDMETRLSDIEEKDAEEAEYEGCSGRRKK